jgi:hypothetical protein
LPVTEAYAASTLTLPLFAGMTEAQQDLVLDALAAQPRGRLGDPLVHADPGAPAQ